MADPLVTRLYADLSVATEEVHERQRQLQESRRGLDRLRRLVLDMKEQYPELFEEDLPVVQDADTSEPMTEPEIPRGQDAVFAVIQEHSGAISSTQILKEMQRRGWAAPVDPEGALRAALRRLMVDFRIVRLDEKDGRAFMYSVAREVDDSGHKGEENDTAPDLSEGGGADPPE